MTSVYFSDVVEEGEELMENFIHETSQGMETNCTCNRHSGHQGSL